MTVFVLFCLCLFKHDKIDDDFFTFQVVTPAAVKMPTKDAWIVVIFVTVVGRLITVATANLLLACHMIMEASIRTAQQTAFSQVGESFNNYVFISYASS